MNTVDNIHDPYEPELGRMLSRLNDVHLRSLILVVYRALGDFRASSIDAARNSSDGMWKAHDYGWAGGLREAQTTIRYETAIRVADIGGGTWPQKQN